MAIVAFRGRRVSIAHSIAMKFSVLVTLFVVLAVSVFATEATVWVSPMGRDSDPGTESAPVATLERAAQLVRAARAGNPGRAVTVWLRPGDYTLLDPLRFGAADSGTAAAPVTWRGTERGRVRLLGARTIPAVALQPLRDPALIARVSAAARARLRELDLAANQVRHLRQLPDTAHDTGDLFLVFFNGRQLPLSRWPNGEYAYTTMQRVLANGNSRSGMPDGGTFVYREDRPAGWRDALADEGVWLRGFWRVPWVSQLLRVKAIDADARTITFAASVTNGIGSKYSKVVDDVRVGNGQEPWCALNLLEEIDRPGEWAVNFRRQRLYVWPPDETGELAIADSNGPMLTFSGASHITFRDITVACHMGDAVSVVGGEAVRFAGCRIEGIGRRGVLVRGGSSHEVRSCDFTDIGLSAIDLLGGDRATLTPAKHQIVNNHLFRIGLAAPVPAILAGSHAHAQNIVGCRIAYNRIHETTYGGITFAGNDNMIERNEIYRVGLDGGDLGALYTTGGWTARGNVVRSNFIHHARSAHAVYMDDGSSGLIVEGNLIYGTDSGIFIGGGHDNVARGNLIVDCARALHVDDRGVARKYVADDPRLRGDLDSVPYGAALWRTRYPSLAGILDRDPSVPHGNVLSGNLAVACARLVDRSGKPETLGGFALEGNAALPSLKVFADPSTLDFTLQDKTALTLPGRPDVDLALYGLQMDEYRPAVPSRDVALLRSGNTRGRGFDSQQDVDAYPR